jgi:F-type H+-transporting ATPase subunit gamma
MAQQLRAIKRRITSVKSTQKITRAFELIASSRIIRAQQRVEAARPYAEEMRRLMGSVSRNVGQIDHPLLSDRGDVNTIGTIVISADRGLAGAYNANVIRTAERDLNKHGKNSELFLVGKKAVSYFRFRGYDFEHSWMGVSDQPSIDDARAVAKAVADAFGEGGVDEVRLAYTRYLSAMTQRPTVMKLLPAPREEFEGDEESEGTTAQYVYEPEPERILGALLPRYIEGTIYQAMLESAASEHAARRRAMKAATDNADELIDNLTRDYNQARQAEITNEIMEIVGGAEALTAAAARED